MKIFITGASGFVGRALTNHFMSLGHEVVAHSRSPQSDLGSTCISCDFSDQRALTAGFEGADMVIHAAGRKSGILAHEYDRDNRDLPLHLFALAQTHSVPKFAFISSATALLDLSKAAQSNIPETQAANQSLNWAYARSKAQAENGLIKMEGAGSTKLLILRPCLIWGGQAPFHKRLASGQFKFWSQGHHRHTHVHIENLVSFVEALSAYFGAQTVFHPQDEQAPDFRTFIQDLTLALGAQFPAQTPATLAKVGAALTGGVGKISLGRYDLGFQGVHALFGREFSTVDGMSRQALGWRPPLELDLAYRRVKIYRPDADLNSE